MQNEFASKELPPEKPTLLPVLLVLSFINTGFFIFFYGIALIAMMFIGNMPYDEFQATISEQMESFPQGADMEELEEILFIFHASGVLIFSLLLLRTIARLIGVIMMYKRKANGFYVYAAAQLIGLFLPFIAMPWKLFGIVGPIMTVAMVALYGSQRKWLVR